MKRLLLAFLTQAVLPVPALAGDGAGQSLLRAAKSVLTLIDSMAVSGIDRSYIGVPRRPWQLMVRGNVNQANLKMSSTIDASQKFLSLQGDLLTEPNITSENGMFVGVWGGYRGYGLGYMKQVSGAGSASLFTLGATGSSYGINFRRHIFETDEFEVRNKGQEATGERFDTIMTSDMLSAVRVKSFILDGYYMFNNRRFSYSAAYDQSAYQLRSAGSLVAGAMYYYSNISYDDPINADMMFTMDNIGRLKQWQISLGAGYAYNYVPVRGLLISGMVMPMLTVYNRLKIFRYDSKYRQMAEDEQILYSEDDLIRLMMDTLIDPGAMGLRPDAENPEESVTSRMRVNFNARASLTYNLGEWAYVNAYGQLYNFRFRHDENNGRLTEWFVNASLGIRL